MNIETKRPSKLIQLNTVEKERLERLAPHFDLNFNREGEVGYELCWKDEPTTPPERLASGSAHVRLLTELCSRCAPWIYFHFGESCQTTLFRLSDSQLLRIAELYAIKKSEVVEE